MAVSLIVVDLKGVMDGLFRTINGLQDPDDAPALLTEAEDYLADAHRALLAYLREEGKL